MEHVDKSKQNVIKSNQKQSSRHYNDGPLPSRTRSTGRAHAKTEAETIFLGARLRMEGLLGINVVDIVNRTRNPWRSTPNMSYVSHLLSLGFSRIREASSFNDIPNLTVHSPLVRTSSYRKSHGKHARDLEIRRRPHGSIIYSLQGRQKAKLRTRAKCTQKMAQLEAEHWIVQNIELNRDFTFANHHIQQQTFQSHPQQTKVMSRLPSWSIS